LSTSASYADFVVDVELFEVEEVEVVVEPDPEPFDDVDDVDPDSEEPELDDPEEPPESEEDFLSLVPFESLLGESLLEPEGRESFR
jgi:hypothetical protein